MSSWLIATPLSPGQGAVGERPVRQTILGASGGGITSQGTPTGDQRSLNLLISGAPYALTFNREAGGTWLSEPVILMRPDVPSDPFAAIAVGSAPARVLSVAGGEPIAVTDELQTWQRDDKHVETGIDAYLWGNDERQNEETAFELFALDGNLYRPGRYDRRRIDQGEATTNLAWSEVDGRTQQAEAALYAKSNHHRTTGIGLAADLGAWGPWDFHDKPVDKLSLASLKATAPARAAGAGRMNLAVIGHGGSQSENEFRVVAYTPRGQPQQFLAPNDLISGGKPVIDVDKLLLVSCFGSSFVDALGALGWKTPAVTINNQRVAYSKRAILSFAGVVDPNEKTRVARHYCAMLYGFICSMTTAVPWDDAHPESVSELTFNFSDPEKGSFDTNERATLRAAAGDPRSFTGTWTDHVGNALEITLAIDGLAEGLEKPTLRCRLTFPGMAIATPYPILMMSGVNQTWTAGLPQGTGVRVSWIHPALDPHSASDFFQYWYATFAQDRLLVSAAYWDFYLTPANNIVTPTEYRWGGQEDGADGHYRYWPGLDMIRLNKSQAFVGEYYLERFAP